ncbi:MAG: hypothetical protein JOZ17_04970 [Acetobacteraceae bacterium]|nr:hypothetical protein [Acetobacteraceae bacterium]
MMVTSGGGLGANGLQPLVQEFLAAGDEQLEVGLDGDRHRARPLQLAQGLGRDQPLLEGPVASAADDPNVSGLEPLTQFGRDAQLVVPAIDRAARQHVGRPARPHEAGRRRTRQARSGLVDLPQHGDGAHQRGAGGYGLERERIQEGGKPTSDAGVVLADRFERIERLRPGERRGLRHRGLEPVPGDHRRDRLISILLAGVGLDERCTDSGVQTHLLIDRPRVGLKGPGMAALGLAEHAPDQPLEQIDGLIGQPGAEVERGGDQRRVSALSLVTGHMLNRGAGGFAGELRQPGLVDETASPRLDANGAHVLEPFDHAEHGSRLGRLRHLPEPGEPAQVAVTSVFEEGVELSTPLRGKPGCQAPMRLLPSAMAQVGAQTLQRRGRRDGDPPLATGLQHQPG